MNKARVTIKVRGRSARFELQEGKLATVGRSSSCAIQVADQSVSREHCVAILADGKVCISDLASTHGVLLGGERVDQCRLGPGDSCHLGNAYFLVEQADAAEQATPAQPRPETAEPAVDNGAGEEVEARDEEAAGPDHAEPGTTAAANPAAPTAEIAGYRVLEPLGSGGFGIVYRAQQVQLGREVALKVMKRDSEAADAKQRIEAFLREARAAAAINDPRLVQVFDVGQDGDTHFLSMELVTGGSLARRLKRHGPMAWDEALPLIRDMALALAAAHRCGLVHRDVKPANILLTGEGRAKLTDLGLASGLIDAGTIAFMAPEQITRQEIDQRTDIYSLGCTAYAMIAGRPPFTGNKKDVAKAHRSQAPEPFRSLGIQLPWHLDQLITESMMAKAPDDRPQSATELLERLDSLILPGTELRSQATRSAPRRAASMLGRERGGGNQGKALAARILSELIVFSMIAIIVIATLLALKHGWPDLDIYRLIGK